MKVPIRAYLASLLLVVGVAGCAKQPPTHYYLLEAAVPSGSGDPSGVRLGIRSFAVDSPYDEAGIVYRVGGDAEEIALYAYHEWAAPLSRLLPRVLADSLGDADGIAIAEPVAPGGDYDAFLDGRLIALEEIDVAGRQEVRLRMTLRLSREDDEIWRRSIAAHGSGSTDQVAGVVALMNDVLVGAVADVRPEIEAALRAER